MRKTTITKICDHCGATLKPESFSADDQLTVTNLNVQSISDPRAAINIKATIDKDLFDFCSVYCLKGFIETNIKAVREELEKADLEKQHALDDLTDVLADKEPGELL